MHIRFLFVVILFVSDIKYSEPDICNHTPIGYCG